MTALLRMISFCLVLACVSAQARAGGAEGPVVVFDPISGDVLAQERAGEPWYPASLTKMMTAFVVFKHLKAGTLKLDQQLVVSELAASMPPSKIGVRPGKTVPADFAIQALLVYSANDMAYVLAEGTSGSSDAFVREMNDTAKSLGMTGTHYVNPNGLFEPRQVSTARDLSILISALIREFPEHNHYFSQAYVAVGKRRLSNRNSLLRQMPEADGMKTGFVCNSGFNLAASATRNGRRLATVIFGAKSGKARADLAQRLLNEALSHPAPTNLVKLSALANDQVGAIVPADMTATVCKQKPTVTLVNAREITGWGISFGQYESAEKADMALRGRLLNNAGADAGGLPGVIRMPGQKTFSALLWNLDEPKSLSLCASYRTANAYCDVMTPQAFAQIAALTPPPPPAQAENGLTQQGSDGAKPTKKRKRKTFKK